MSFGFTSPLEWAIKLASGGYKILYIESGAIVRDLLSRVHVDDWEVVEKVRRSYPEMFIRTINDGEVRFILTEKAGRGYSADAVFLPDRIRSDLDSMADILPTLALSRLPEGDQIYALFERVN